MKFLSYSVAATIALAGLTLHNTALWKENRQLKATIENTAVVVRTVEKDVIKFIREDSTIPAETKERLVTVIKEGNKRVSSSLATLPPPAEQRLGLQTGYNGRRWVGGVDYQLIRRDRWSFNTGLVGAHRFGGPTASLGFKPWKNYGLTFLGTVCYNLPSQDVKSFIGVRLPL